MKPQTVTEGLDLILTGEVSARDIHARVVQSSVGPTTDLIRLERAVQWLAARLDAEIKKTETIIDEVGLRGDEYDAYQAFRQLWRSAPSVEEILKG